MNMRVLSRQIQSFIMTQLSPSYMSFSLKYKAWEIVQKLHHYWYFVPVNRDGGDL